MMVLTLLITILIVCSIVWYFPYFSTCILGPVMLLMVTMMTITKTRPESFSLARFVGSNPENIFQSFMMLLLSYGVFLGLGMIMGGALRIEWIDRAKKMHTAV